MKVTAVEPQKRHPERVNVYVDGEFRLGLAAEVALAEGVRPGVEATEARLAAWERRDRTWLAREAALSLLGVRARSGDELRMRLRRKGFEAEVADAVVTRLEEMGMVDDPAFAESWVRDRVRLRPKGKRALRQELRGKGVDEATAEAAIREVMEGEETSELELARRAAERWRPRTGEEPARARRRLWSYLARRGFGGEAARVVVDEVLGDEEPGPI